jgi:hypothetical protein
MSWFWLNMAPGAVFVLAISGIPLWIVLRHPDRGPSGTGPALTYRSTAGGDPLQLTNLLGIRDPTAIRYGAEIGPGRYDEHQALEGATGSAGRTESTSVST